MTSYPVSLDLQRPATFSRPQVFLRLLLLIVLSWLTGSPTEFGLVYVGLPVVAAIFIARHPDRGYRLEDRERVTSVVGFIVSMLAYLALLTDALPNRSAPPVTFAVVASGEPTVGAALLRILTAIPNALVLIVIGVVSWVVWFVAAISILVTESYPKSLWNFQLGVVRWEARLLSYLACLVEPYPSFAFEAGNQ